MGKCLSFHVKFVQIDRQRDRWMDRRTMVKQYAPNLTIRGHKKKKNRTQKLKFVFEKGRRG